MLFHQGFLKRSADEGADDPRNHRRPKTLDGEGSSNGVFNECACAPSLGWVSLGLHGESSANASFGLRLCGRSRAVLSFGRKQPFARRLTNRKAPAAQDGKPEDLGGGEPFLDPRLAIKRPRL